MGETKPARLLLALVSRLQFRRALSGLTPHKTGQALVHTRIIRLQYCVRSILVFCKMLKENICISSLKILHWWKDRKKMTPMRARNKEIKEEENCILVSYDYGKTP